MRSIKEIIAEKWDLRAEFDALLGEGRGTTRRCFNRDHHRSDDKTPSLSFNPKTGSWRCHSCGSKGDFFTLRSLLQKENYGQTITYLLKKYGLWDELGRNTRPRTRHDPVPDPKDEVGQRRSLVVTNADYLKEVRLGNTALLDNASLQHFIKRRYGLTEATVAKYMLGVGAHNRLLIPVWGLQTGMVLDDADREVGLHPIVNVRKHDILRESCSWFNASNGEIRRRPPKEVGLEQIMNQDHEPWVPKWDGRYGKVLSLEGHGMPWVYPYEVLLSNPAVYVVGGELKALLLNQCGIPAVSFTGGEGKVAYPLVPLFIGKHVRVLMDPDAAGVKGAEDVSTILAEAGAYVEMGRWPDLITERLPPKGDITDYLRLLEYRAEEALQYLEWVEVKRVVVEGDVPLDRAPVPQDLKWEDFREALLPELLDPRSVKNWVRVRGVPVGRSSKSYAIPHEVKWSCPWGEANEMPLCRKCTLPEVGHRKSYLTTPEDKMSYMGTATELVRKNLRIQCGIVPRCQYLQEDVHYAVAETILVTPPLDREIDPAEVEDKKTFEYVCHPVTIISPTESIQMRENVAYDLGVQVVPEPRSSRLTGAVVQYRSSQNDIFHHVPDPSMGGRLLEYFSDRDGLQERWDYHLDCLSRNVTRVYKSEGMLASILLTFFAPFRFYLGTELNQRICPVTLILGDTTVGKSTVVKHLIAHYGAGRFKSMDAKPTFAGLVGGNLQVGGEMLFHWGILPSSDGGLVGLDELNKLQVEDIGALTALISSGKAERTTVNGDRQTRCFVRLVALANPRGTRPLKSLDPYDALQSLMGTTQDLGRVEWVCLQRSIQADEFTKVDNGEIRSWDYDRALAHYHLSWAWTRGPKQIKVTDLMDFEASTRILISKWGHTDLMRPAMAKWKLGRLASAFAMATYSTDQEGQMVFVRPQHVEMALRFYDERYRDILPSAESVTQLPEIILRILERLERYEGLLVLLNMQTWTREDAVAHLMPRPVVNELIVYLQNLGLVSLQRGYYRILEPRHDELLRAYVLDRKRRDAEVPKDKDTDYMMDLEEM